MNEPKKAREEHPYLLVDRICKPAGLMAQRLRADMRGEWSGFDSGVCHFVSLLLFAFNLITVFLLGLGFCIRVSVTV